MERLISRIRRLRQADGRISSRVRAVLVESLYASPRSLVIGALTSSAIAAVVAICSGDEWLVVCAVAVGLVGVVRIVDTLWTRQSATVPDQERGYRLGALSYATLLGLFGLLTLTRTENGVLHLLSVTTAIGYAAGIAGRNAGRPLIALSQLCCASLPLAVGLLIPVEPLKALMALVIVLFVVAMMDITQQTYGAILRATIASEETAALAEHHAEMARRDDLTGVSNRTAFREHFEERLQGLAASGDRLALLWLDLDRFKEVNDSFGHLAGNALLVAVARRLNERFRGKGLVARLGGDEFAVLCHVSHHETAGRIGTAILDLVRQPVSFSGHMLHITPSIGVAIAPDDGNDADTLLKNADLALYRAKESGRGQVLFYEPVMDEKIERRRQLGAAMNGALERNEFHLLFQPIFCLTSGDIASCEALLRWDSPQFGAVAPGEFIPIAEENGLIVPIGGWVLHQACQVASGWASTATIAVNLSPVQLRTPELAVTVVSALQASGLPAKRLTLEVTETVLLDDVERSLAALTTLNQIDVCTTLDDFGTGYSSLSYLTQFPFQTLKIDRSFVMDLEHNPASIAIVQTIVELAAKLGMRTVAEGVETPAQLDQLRRTRCDAVQGYLLAKPMPANEVLALFTAACPATKSLGQGHSLPEAD
ncbi:MULTISPECIES: putative bifunctional diguanylate cyclase/phosphodiesterase [Sphingomonas]|jgi:diguanylate cyclase (GGDEF)-like protein|uniref:EAL domain-containing protein n=1 Tax=Sphingomonas zeae TaxID=1646122 RepID=A0A7Y6B178_9SPHN|nr:MULTISPECIES: EAL domain-containing protein [Sphingomonas]MBB4050262.1 diguanylate cyclase (GGDEF)-like protein [Sphingomonas zeae]MDK8188249.1 EAL domain-containing protein [Sphingomonas zeae]MDK8218165.1 EAL domain-containing protein [Sphingomonas sp. UMB7805-LC452B]NUU45536.1 EAL domain-containing protein [Sphingomonas zeae]